MPISISSNKHQKRFSSQEKKSRSNLIFPRINCESNKIEKDWLKTPKRLQKAIQSEIDFIRKRERQHKEELKKLSVVIRKDIRILNTGISLKSIRERQKHKKQKLQQSLHLKQHRAIEKAMVKLQMARKIQLEKQAKFEVIFKQIKVLQKTWRNYLPKSSFKETEGRQLLLGGKKTTSSNTNLLSRKTPSVLSRIIDSE